MINYTKDELQYLEYVKAQPPISRLKHWIKERESIRLKKEAGKSKPWTQDPILKRFRFCNVNRENDKVTKWISTNWRTPHKDEPDLWFAMCVARLFNLPSTLEAIGFPVPFKPVIISNILTRQRGSQTIFNGAYIVSTNGRSMDKLEYVLYHILLPLWKNRISLRPARGMELQQYAEKLMEFNGFSSFMSGQVVADLKYVEPLKSAKDWWTFAVPGPGSKRGLNRVLGRPPETNWPKGEWEISLGNLHTHLESDKTLPKLHAQDIQNSLCEVDKYNRVLFDEGTPKQKYPGV